MKKRVWSLDGWELLRSEQSGRTPRVIFTLNSPKDVDDDWRLYTSRTSPHSVEVQFEKRRKQWR